MTNEIALRRKRAAIAICKLDNSPGHPCECIETQTDVCADMMAAVDAVIDVMTRATNTESSMPNNEPIPARPPIMQFFAYAHLPPPLQAVSAPFGLLAEQVVHALPNNPERDEALRKLLEAKDCAVRALLYK